MRYNFLFIAIFIATVLHAPLSWSDAGKVSDAGATIESAVSIKLQPLKSSPKGRFIAFSGTLAEKKDLVDYYEIAYDDIQGKLVSVLIKSQKKVSVQIIDKKTKTVLSSIGNVGVVYNTVSAYAEGPVVISVTSDEHHLIKAFQYHVAFWVSGKAPRNALDRYAYTHNIEPPPDGYTPFVPDVLPSGSDVQALIQELPEDLQNKLKGGIQLSEDEKAKLQVTLKLSDIVLKNSSTKTNPSATAQLKLQPSVFGGSSVLYNAIIFIVMACIVYLVVRFGRKKN